MPPTLNVAASAISAVAVIAINVPFTVNPGLNIAARFGISYRPFAAAPVVASIAVAGFGAGAAAQFNSNNIGSLFNEAWILVGGTPGAYTAVVTFTGLVRDVVAGVHVFNEVNQATPTGTITGNSGNDALPTTSILGVPATGLICDTVITDNGILASPGVSNAGAQDWGLSAGLQGLGSHQTPSGTLFDVISWTLPAVANWVTIADELIGLPTRIGPLHSPTFIGPI